MGIEKRSHNNVGVVSESYPCVETEQDRSIHRTPCRRAHAFVKWSIDPREGKENRGGGLVLDGWTTPSPEIPESHLVTGDYEVRFRHPPEGGPVRWEL